MAQRALKTVSAGPKSVTQAASSGTTRELLVAMRDRVADAVESPSTAPRDLASLTKRLMDIALEIAEIDAREDAEGSGPVGDEAFDREAL